MTSTTTQTLSLPCAPALPLLGCLPALLRDQFDALDRWQREVGGFYELPLGPSRAIMVADPDIASEILVDRATTFTRGGPFWESLAKVFGDGMLTAEGELWRKRRSLIQPYFHHKTVRSVISNIAASVDEIYDQWAEQFADGAVIDTSHKSSQLTMAVIVRMIFGTRISDADYEYISHTLDYAIDRIAVGWLTYNLPRWLPIPGRARYLEAIAKVDALVANFVERRRASGDWGNDALGMLIHLLEEGGLDHKGLRDETVSLFIAGYETTGNSLGFSFWELADKPAILQRLRAEADEVLGPGGRTPIGDDIEKIDRLEYAHWVFKESLRMYPGSLWLPRIAQTDEVLAGVHIPAGTTLMISLYSIQNDPRWWDEPRVFRPERHAPDATPPRHRHALMPFGLGRHMCVGQRLAMVEGPLALARLAQRFDLETIPGRVPKMKISTGLGSVDGIWLKIHPRAS